MKSSMKYFLIMIIPLVVLLTRPITPLVVLTFGQEVKLATEPFDPRDYFRGDYVELSFEIENINTDIISPNLLSKLKNLNIRDVFSPSAERNERIDVYASLKPDTSGIYNVTYVSDKPPEDELYIHGKIIHTGNTIRINYGNNLSRFYVKENTGLELEEAARRGKIHALARVWKGRIVLDTIEKIE